MTDCIFCKIINKEIPAKIIAENDEAIAFLDIDPATLGHTLIVPKVHYDNFSQTSNTALSAVSSLAKEVALSLKNSTLKAEGINYVSNEGAIANQVVNHLHLHVIPRYQDSSKSKNINQEEAYLLLKEYHNETK